MRAHVLSRVRTSRGRIGLCHVSQSSRDARTLAAKYAKASPDDCSGELEDIGNTKEASLLSRSFGNPAADAFIAHTADLAGERQLAGTRSVTVSQAQVDGDHALRAAPSRQFGVSAPEREAEGEVAFVGKRERRFVKASREVETLKQDDDLLGMHPGRLAVQQELVHAKSAGRVLQLLTDRELEEMDAINLTTSLHRLATLAGPSRALVVVNDRFERLLDVLPYHLSEMSPQGLVNVLWSLVRLEVSPEWLTELLQQCVRQHASFSIKDLCGALCCLAKAPMLEGSSSAVDLKTSAVAALRARSIEFRTPTDLAVVASTLSRLAIRDEEIFGRVADHVVAMADTLVPSEIASIMWGFANLNLTHGGMIRELRRVLVEQINFCTPRELVQISWAFSKLKQADVELLSEICGPVIRAKLLEFDAPRDLCTLTWTFSNASVADHALFNDLAHVLATKVKRMNGHDVSSVAVAFASMEYAHQRLYRAMQKHTRNIAHSMTPLQLSRTIYGFGVAGIEDDKLFRILCEHVLKRQPMLHAKNIVEVIVGLVEAEYTPRRVFHALLSGNARVFSWLKGEDAIQLLHALSRLPEKGGEPFYSDETVSSLMNIVRRRSQGWWRFSAQDAADLLEAMRALGSVDVALVHSLCRQLQRILSRPCCTSSLFLRLWGALAELEAESRAVVREHLGRRPGIREEVERWATVVVRSSALPCAAEDVDPAAASLRAAVLTLFACARLGYDGEAVLQLVCAIKLELCQTRPTCGIDSTSEQWWPLLVWSLAELRLQDDLARDCLEIYLRGRYGIVQLPSRLGESKHVFSHALVSESGLHFQDQLSIGLLLHLAWSCVALCGEVPDELTRDIRSQMDAGVVLDADHRDLYGVVVLQLMLEQVASAPDNALPDAGTLEVSHGLSSRGVLRRESTEPSLWERWLSSALMELRVPHESPCLLLGVHRVAAVLAEKKLALEILGPMALATPSQRLLRSAAVRQRQLEAMGWGRFVLLQADAERIQQEEGSLVGMLEALAPSWRDRCAI